MNKYKSLNYSDINNVKFALNVLDDIENSCAITICTQDEISSEYLKCNNNKKGDCLKCWKETLENELCYLESKELYNK